MKYIKLKEIYDKVTILKKAAMFGLDARIALAIFGALSVISGAALYSAIKAAKTEQLHQYFVEYAKASDAYYLDTGQELPMYTGDTYNRLWTQDLLNNRENLRGWQGPYKEGSTYLIFILQDSFTSRIDSLSSSLITLRQASTWTEMNDLGTDEHCVVNSTDCSEWVSLYAGGGTSTIQSMFTDLDELIDNSDGKLAGNIRYNEQAGDYIMYKGRSRIKKS